MDEKRELFVDTMARTRLDSDTSTLVSSPTEADDLFDKEADMVDCDEEGRSLPEPAKRPSRLTTWIVVNVVATVLIRIFSDPNFSHAQVTFASYHFFITHITLHIMSTSSFNVFERRQLGLLDLLPLASSMCLSVVLQNTSLQHCSVPFYQTVRVLLTPITAALNFFLYRQGIPWQAAVMLLPTCAGVGLMAYYDTKKAGSGQSQTTTVGATFALTGVVASAIYTVWVGRYQKKLDTSSIQLLHQQSLFGAVLLLFCIPFIDKLPHYSDVPFDRWIAILLSGTCAVIINVSSFNIIGHAGAVSATVVGHGKTVCIVVLGWFIGGKAVNHGSIAGIAVAIAGILAYSAASMHYKR